MRQIAARAGVPELTIGETSLHQHSVDHLRGAEYLFNTLSDPREAPINGDIRVLGIQVNRIVIARHDESPPLLSGLEKGIR